MRLSIDGQYQGELPLTLEMSRNFVGGQQFVARFEKAGYATQEFKLKREFNTVAILDISSTVVSGGIDVLSGALMKFSPRDYHVQMLPEGASSAGARRGLDALRFALVNHAAIQKDLARGGGEHLATLALLLADGDPVRARRIETLSLQRATELVADLRPHVALEALDRLLASDPDLRSCRL